MNEQRFNFLLEQYITGNHTKPEKKEFFALLEDPYYRSLLEKILEREWQQEQYEEERNERIGKLVKENVMGRIKSQARLIPMHRQPLRNILRIAAAAVIILAVAAGGYFFFSRNKASTLSGTGQKEIQHDAQPGGNKAILTLGNGRQVILDSAQNGMLASEGAAKVSKVKDGTLSYTSDNSVAALIYNTITTPRGGQYHIQLADGTLVWLNAASSLRFPTVFKGQERNVEITGEAYFEVAHDKTKPFRVSVNGMQVEVLGTHFNMNAYDDGGLLKTTLTEGKVKILKGSSIGILSPGEQARMNDAGQLNIVNDVDLDEVLAWKNGLFKFNSSDIETIMKQVERWYDLDVVYEGEKPGGHYNGKISRDIPAMQMLQIIEASGVHFKIEGKKLIVLK